MELDEDYERENNKTIRIWGLLGRKEVIYTLFIAVPICTLSSSSLQGYKGEKRLHSFLLPLLRVIRGKRGFYCKFQLELSFLLSLQRLSTYFSSSLFKTMNLHMKLCPSSSLYNHGNSLFYLLILSFIYSQACTVPDVPYEAFTIIFSWFHACPSFHFLLLCPLTQRVKFSLTTYAYV